ncbi:hypothetical protein ACFVP8_07980 [Viridibacillus arvi]|uniref:hypothetical protein n=1 Tax=Viridibacillus arvi TaxID=263475 RepID=UPI0036BFAB25
MAIHNQYQQKHIQQPTPRPYKKTLPKWESVLHAKVIVITLLSVMNSLGLKLNEKNVKVVSGQ